MLTAVIARPPLFGATLKSVDKSAALKVRGVTDVVEVPAGVAVLGKGFWAARQGRAALKLEWDESRAEHRGTDELLAEYKALALKPGASARRDGDPAAAFAGAAKTVEAIYEFPYLAHAPMEPLDCVVKLSADRCEVWAGLADADHRPGGGGARRGSAPGQGGAAHASRRRQLRPKGDAPGRRRQRGGQHRQGHRRPAGREARVDPRGRHPGRPLSAPLRPPPPRGSRRRGTHRGLGASHRGAVLHEGDALRGLHQGRHRRHHGRGCVEPALRHPQPRGRPAHRRCRRAYALVAVGGLHPHHLRRRDLPRRAGQGRRPRSASSCAASCSRAIRGTSGSSSWPRPRPGGVPPWPRVAPGGSPCRSRSTATWPRSSRCRSARTACPRSSGWSARWTAGWP